MLRAFAILLLTAAAGAAAPFEPTLLAKLGSDRFRYPGVVTKITASPDGKWVAVSGSAPTWVYEFATGRPVWQGPRDSLLGFTLSVAQAFRGDRLVTLQYDSSAGVGVYHYDLHGPPRPVHVVKLKVEAAEDAAFTPDGTLLAVPNGRRVTLFDTHTGREVNRVLLPRGSGGASDVAFSPDGRRLGVRGEKGGVFTFDRLTGREMARYKPKQSPRAVTISPDGNRLSAILEDNSLESINLLTGVRKKWKVGDETFDEIIGLPGNQVLTMEMSEGKFQVFDATTGKKVRTVPAPKAEWGGVLYESLVLAPDGRTLLCGVSGDFATEAAVLALDLTTGRPRPQSATEDVGYTHFRFHGADQLSGARSTGPPPGEERFVWTRWQLPNGGRTQLADPPDVTTHDLSQDGLWSLTVSGYRLAVVSTATGKAAHTTFLPIGSDPAAAWFRDGDRQVAIRTATEVFIWEPASGRVRRVKAAALAGLETRIAAGRWFATYSADFSDDPAAPRKTKPVVTVYDLDAGRRTIQLDSALMDDWRFTPDGRWLVRHSTAQLFTPDGTSSSRLDVQFLDPATGRVARRVATTDGNHLLDIAPDGRTLLLAGESDSLLGANDAVLAVEAATGKVRWRLPPLGDWSVTGGSFAPDGRRVAVGSGDGFVRVWGLGGSGEPMPAEKLWAALGDADAERAFDAIRTLGRSPDVAVPLLWAKLPPAVAVDMTKVAGWLVDLDAPAFAVRDAATKKLAAALPQARPALEATLAVTPSVEVRERVTNLLEGAARLSSADVRTIRAVEAVERIATDAELATARPAAVALLRVWAAGAADAVLTAEATDALDRLKVAASGGR